MLSWAQVAAKVAPVQENRQKAIKVDAIESNTKRVENRPPVTKSREANRFFEVWCNEKPAVYPEEPCWRKYQYDTWEDAKQYATQWLGEWSSVVDHLEPDKRCYYVNYGDGDYVEIKTIYQPPHLTRRTVVYTL